MAAEAKERADVPKPPPNLRIAPVGQSDCDDCKHFADGKCVLYSGLPVNSEWLCDSFAKKPGPGDDTPRADQPKTLKAASAQARDRFRPGPPTAPKENQSGIPREQAETNFPSKHRKQ